MTERLDAPINIDEEIKQRVGYAALYRACQRENEPESVWRERYRLVRRIMRAITLEEARVVAAEVEAWIADHPGDMTVMSAMEPLGNIYGSAIYHYKFV